MPPAIRTSVCPKTSGASSEICLATFSALLQVRKYSLAENAKVRKIATAISAAVCCPPSEKSRPIASRLWVPEDAVGPDDRQEHQALGDLLALDRDAEQDQQIVEHAEHQHADHRAQRRPRPPNRLVPPSTAAMMESKSMPTPALATVLPVREVMMSPASAAVPPQSMKAMSLMRRIGGRTAARPSRSGR